MKRPGILADLPSPRPSIQVVGCRSWEKPFLLPTTYNPQPKSSSECSLNGGTGVRRGSHSPGTHDAPNTPCARVHLASKNCRCNTDSYYNTGSGSSVGMHI